MVKRSKKDDKTVEDILNTKYAAESIIRSAKQGALNTEITGWLDTENADLNSVLGHPEKGLPLGRFIEISGGESHGKTALLYYLLGKVQQAGGTAILFDNDGSYDREWAEKLGIDHDKLVFLQLGTKTIKKENKEIEQKEAMEDLFKKIGSLIEESKKEPDTPVLFGWDDITGTLTRKEIDSEEYASDKIAVAAKVLSQGICKLHSELKGTKFSIICINQLRTKIAIGFGFTTEQTTGGKALRYYAAVRAKISRTSSKPTHISCQIKCEKNKIARPFKIAKLIINFDKGIVLK